MKLPISIIILTYNEELNIGNCLKSITDWVDEVFIIDSYSTDSTAQIAKRYGAKIIQHPFKNQSDQFNWALDNIKIKNDWILRLDADELMTKELWREIVEVLPKTPNEINGFYIKRRVYFEGRWIKHGDYYPSWFLRLWRKDKGRVEEREVDEHTILLEGKEGKLQNYFIDDNKKNIEAWIFKLNIFSTREARERLRNIHDIRFKPGIFGEQVLRKRWFKENFYYRLPLFYRAFFYFIYRYFFRLGFLDGKEGLIFHFIQGFWHRFLIDTKIYETVIKKQIAGVAKNEIAEFWNQNPCGTFGFIHDTLDLDYFKQITIRRYKIIPFIKKEIKFDSLKGKKVLEIGCGIGTDGLEFVKAGADYTGIDISEKSVKLAKTNFELSGFSSENILLADAENLPFSDNTFDFIYSCGVLHHTPNISKSLSEIYRVLKSSGHFWIMLYNLNSLVGLQLYAIYGILRLRPFISWKKLFAEHHESPGTKAFTDRKAIILFQGFKGIKIKNIVTPYDVRITRNRYLPNFFQHLIPSRFGFFKVITGSK
ncbi:MAG: methyltransferase domain-containing protein [Patescibacteria group bacterium]